MHYWPVNCCSDSQRPCERSRFFLCDDHHTTQIWAFVASLSTEQISFTATLLMEQYIRRSAISATPHADDVAGFEASRFVAKSLSVCPGNDPSWGKSSKGDQVASSPSYCCDHWDYVYCQFPFIREGFTANADVDVSWVLCTAGKMVSMSYYLIASSIFWPPAMLDVLSTLGILVLCDSCQAKYWFFPMVLK